MSLSTRAGFALGLAAVLFASTAWAADAPLPPSAPVKATIHRASQVIGMSVANAAGENIGTVNDVVIDAKSGQCRYLAISFGTTFGFGGKLFAVPYNAVLFRYDSKNNNSFVMFDVRKEQLEQAPGFASDKWPDFGDARFTGTVDKFYEAHRPGVNVEVRPDTRAVPEAPKP